MTPDVTDKIMPDISVWLLHIKNGFSIISRLIYNHEKGNVAEGLGVSANIFVGMVESLLLIRPYLKDMTRSELFTIMTCGMGTMVPERRNEIISLGFRSIVAGILATCMTGAIVGILS